MLQKQLTYVFEVRRVADFDSVAFNLGFSLPDFHQVTVGLSPHNFLHVFGRVRRKDVNEVVDVRGLCDLLRELLFAFEGD